MKVGRWVRTCAHEEELPIIPSIQPWTQLSIWADLDVRHKENIREGTWDGSLASHKLNVVFAVVRVFVCAHVDTLVGPTLLSSLCIDRFVGAAAKATGVRQQRKNKESWLIDEV